MFVSYSIHLEHYTYWLTEQSSELCCRVKCSVLVSAIFDMRTKTVMYLTSKLSCSRHNTWCTRIEPATSGLPLSRLIQQTTNSLIFFIFFYFPENGKTGYVIPCYVDNLICRQICFLGKEKCHQLKILPSRFAQTIRI